MLEAPGQGGKRVGRVAILYTVGDKTHTMTEWAAILKVSRVRLYQRLKEGWSWKRTFSMKGRVQPLVKHGGRAQTAKAWALELGLKPATLRQRLRRGRKLKDIIKELKDGPSSKPS